MKRGKTTETMSFSLSLETVRKLRRIREERCVNLSRLVEAALEEAIGKALKEERQWMALTD